MPTFDCVIKGGTVIDGRNFPRFRADVGIKDGKIARIGRIPAGEGERVLDAEGMIVAPGVIDLHTHYDAQLFWDPYVTMSGWHGVTSIVIGNCGFGFAPAHEEHRDYLMKMLTRTEAIPSTCMELTLPWTWESFPEWMDTLDQLPKGVNALTYVPLNPLLVYVMGFDAKTREPTEAELAEMSRLLREAMDAGACGWSAQRTKPGGGFDVQRDFDGTPFCTDVMSDATALALGKVLADYDHAFIQTALIGGDPFGETEHLEELAEISDSNIIFNAIATFSAYPEAHHMYLNWVRLCQEAGLKIFGQLITTGAGFTFTFEDWNLYDDSPAWNEATVGTPAERLAKFQDPARRQAMKEHPPNGFPLDYVVLLKTYTEKFMPAKGTMLPDAAVILGYDNLTDLILDIAIADELRTLFQCPQANDDKELQNELIVAPYGLWGVSDGGAHSKFLTAGAYPTESIIEFVRERGVVTLEEAHWRLSGLPARAAGFRHRGTLVEGAPADIVVYDYENLTLLDEEVAEDLPGGEWRRVRRAEGYRYTLVNGEITFIDGKPSGATPGRLLRHGVG